VISNKVVVKLRERDPYCVHCGSDTNLQIHHRKNRGMGGSKLLDTFPNLIRVCAELNYAMESDSQVAEEAREKGWKLSQWGDFDTPVFDNIQQTWFTLTKEGNKNETEGLNGLFL